MGAANDKLAKGDACWPKEEVKVHVKKPEIRMVKIPYYPNKIMIKSAIEPDPKNCPKAPKKKFVPRPIAICEEEEPCDPCIPVDTCPEPRICKNKIKNPYENMWETRCKGPYIPVEVCKKKPALPASLPDCGPPTCIPINKQTKSEPCPEPALRKDKVKNMPPKDKKCKLDPEELISRPLCENIEILKIKIPKQERRPGERIQIDPFLLVKCKREAEQDNKDGKKKKDPNDYKYSRTLCRYKDVMAVKPEAPPKFKRIVIDPHKLLRYKEKMKKCEESYNPCTDERRD